MSKETTENQYSHGNFSTSPYDYYSGGSDNRVGLAKELDPQKALINTIHTLRGEIRDPETGRVVHKIQRSINEKGVALFANAVIAGANSINTYSNYRTDDKLIHRLVQKWINDLIYEFFYNRKDYMIHINEKGEEEICLINEESYASVLINMAVGLILPSFYKALGAGDRSAVTRTISEMIQRSLRESGLENQNIQPKRRGILSRLNPFSN